VSHQQNKKGETFLSTSALFIYFSFFCGFVVFD